MTMTRGGGGGATLEHLYTMYYRAGTSNAQDFLGFASVARELYILYQIDMAAQKFWELIKPLTFL